MRFNGDLSKYHPADAIMFLSQLSLDGVLSVAHEQRLITLSFNHGFIIDAHSAKGDAKLLNALIFHRRVSADQVRRIQRIQAETDLPVRAILNQLDLIPLAGIGDLLLIGMQEVMLEMFLLDAGAFHFTDTPVEPDDAHTRLDARMIAIRVAAQSDDYRDFEKRIVSLDRPYTFKPPADHPSDVPTETKVVLRLLAACRTLRQVFDKAPVGTAVVLEVIKEQVEAGTIQLHAADTGTRPTPAAASEDPLFASFRRHLKKLMLTDDPLKRLEALIAFCKGFYDGILILTAKAGKVVHCKSVRRESGRGFEEKSIKGVLGAVDEEPIVEAVHRSGVGFFGSRFPSALLDRLSLVPESGECALIPVIRKGQVAVFVYAFSETGFSGLSPQHYLELLSWMVTPRSVLAGRGSEPTPAADPFSPRTLVAGIHDLPPLPTLVTRLLDMLADPDVDIRQVRQLVEKDQSLVTKLIKISNSALFGGVQRVESIQQALSRLGAKTARSLILSASMQTYFFKHNPGMRTWGQLLWQHAAECGMAARRIAAATGFDEPELAFVGGVLHDIGKLVIMLASPDAYRQIQNLRKREPRPDYEIERMVVRTDHMEIGDLLMDKWNMPLSAKMCVKWHHDVDHAGDANPLAAITAYANHLSHLHGTRLQRDAGDPDAVSRHLTGLLALSEDDNHALVEAVIGDFQQTDLL
jgi:HD-like signal output (HDOD) protein